MLVRKRLPALSHRVRRHEAADHDFAAVTDVPDHGFADRVAAIADHGVLGHRHPLAFDRDPVGARAKIIFGAMAVGDITTGHAVRGDHALEPGTDLGWDVLILPVVEG